MLNVYEANNGYYNTCMYNYPQMLNTKAYTKAKQLLITHKLNVYYMPTNIITYVLIRS